MTSRPGFFIQAIVSAVIVTCSSAGCAKCFPASGNYSFHGSLSDGKRLGATLSIGSQGAVDITGTVFIAPLYQEIAVIGEIDSGDELRLRRQSDGAILFDGWFVDHLDGMGPLTCDFAAGPWADGGSAALRLQGWGFRLDRLPPDEQAHLNAVVLDIYNAIETRDAKRLAKHVRFPLTIGFPDAQGARRTIANEKALVEKRNEIIGPNMLNALSDEVPHDPFCRDGECMLGHGVIWIDEDLKIVGLIPG